VYEIVKARVWFSASKYHTILTVLPRRSTPKVPRVPGASSVSLLRVYATPRSTTSGLTSDSPARSGMSRYPKWKSPEKATFEALAHADRAVRLHLDADVRREQREAVSRSCGRDEERNRRSGRRER
jgi:hypothetical protein